MNTTNHTAPASPYLASQILSASPVQLITLMYDGIIRFLSAAHDGFAESDPQVRFETINNNLIRAQNIVTELQACLDMEKGKDIAKQLDKLYDFFNTTLRQVNSAKDPAVIMRIIHMVCELRDAWKEISVQGSPGAETTSGTVSSAQQLAVKEAAAA